MNRPDFRSGSEVPITARQYQNSVRAARRTAVVCMLFAATVAGDSAAQQVEGDSAAAEPTAVSALGRLEPRYGIVRVSAGSLPEAVSGSIVTRLLVEAGDDVEAGDLLAVTDTETVLAARVDESRAELGRAKREAEASQSQALATCVRAGVARREADRLQRLLAQRLASEEETDGAIGAAEASAADCTAAETAAKVGESAIRVVEARLSRHLAELERSRVKAPMDGRVLAIHARPGELVGLDGILELGDVANMRAIAEVYETDVRRLVPGQSATVTSAALPAPLNGQIARIRPKVQKQDEIGTDPAARKDARIVEVEVELDEPAAAAGLTNLQVDVVFGR